MAVDVTIIPCRSDNFGYLLTQSETGARAVVDAPEAGPLIEAIEAAGGRLDLILLTHHHGDHVEAVAPLVERYGAAVVGAAADARRLPKLTQAVVEGDAVGFGATQAQVLEVSGHTIGHIAYHFPEAGMVFNADSLMALGCGRLFEGTAAQMWESLSKLSALPAETLVYSGHDYFDANARFALSVDGGNAALTARIARKEAGEAVMPVTVAEELATNPFLRAVAPEVKAAVGLPEAEDAAVFAEIRRRKDAF